MSYDLYTHCRTVQLFGMDVPKDGGKKVEKKAVFMPTGFHTLPEPGGMLDQPYRLMVFFQNFLEGERRAAFEELSS